MQYRLKLTPYGEESIVINLTDCALTSRESDESLCVFSHLTYTMELDFEHLADVAAISFLINDEEEDCYYTDGKINFPAITAGEKKIFADCFGFVKLGILITFKDGQKTYVHSNYLPVFIKESEITRSIERMLEYVYKNQEELLAADDDGKSAKFNELASGNNANLESRVALAEKIVAIYRENYQFFKVNRKFITEKVETIDRLEKLQYITPRSIQFIASHPEQLRLCVAKYGVKIGKKIYHPEKVMTMQDRYSANTYENCVVLSFLGKITGEVSELQKKTESAVSSINYGVNKSTAAQQNNALLHPARYMFGQLETALENLNERLKKTSAILKETLALYMDIMPIPLDKMLSINTMPEETSVFVAIPQYNQVFTCIYEWLNSGAYDLDKEKFMFSFLKISALYEGYVLAKLIEYFKSDGYSFRKEKCPYPFPETMSPFLQYMNARYCNTFIFNNALREITVFYQPIIYNYSSEHVNGITLYRNNSVSISKDLSKSSGSYYVPDFIIKIKNERDAGAKYIICDAKFSSLDTVRNYRIFDLSFKYLFSMGLVNGIDKLLGLCVIYGKCGKNDSMQSFYDNELNSIAPFAELLPLTEMKTESNFKCIKQLLNKAI